MTLPELGTWTDAIWMTGDGMALKGLFVLAAAALLVTAARKASAAFKHLVWCTALLAALCIPVVTLFVPTLDVGVLPRTASIDLSAPTPASDMPVSVPDVERSRHQPVVVDPGASTSFPAVSTVITWVWLAGMTGVLCWLLTGVVRAVLLVRRAEWVTETAWLGTIHDLSARLGIRRPVLLMRSTEAGVPFSWGVARPVVVLPAGADEWNDEKRRCVVAHELAHIRRMDCLTQAAATLAVAVHWFNPLAWRAAHRMRVERELACDAAVLEATQARASSYASYLIDIAHGIGSRLRVPAPAVMMAERSQLEGRVLGILNSRRAKPLQMHTVRLVAVIAILSTALLGVVRPTVTDASSDVAAMGTNVAGVLADVGVDAAGIPVDVGVVWTASGEDRPFLTMAGESLRTDRTSEAAGRASATADEGGRRISSTVLSRAADVIERSFQVVPGGRLEISTDVGNIRVESGGDSRVDIEVHRQVRGDAAESDLDVEFEQNGSTIRVLGERSRADARRSGLHVEFVVYVPTQFDLDLNTSGGNVVVGDLDGTVEVRTAGGNLSFGRITGTIDAHTSGGNVSIDGSDGDVEVTTSGGDIRLGRAGGTVEVRTSGGNITVDDVFGDIDAQTSGGQITARLARQPEGDCRLETSGGSITVYLADGIAVDLDAETSAGRVDTEVEVAVEGRIEKDRLRGRINGGGPRLVLDTSAGDVRIKSW